MSESPDATRPNEIRRKRPLSMTPGAIRGRVHRRRRKQRVVMVMVPIAERDIDALETGGHLNVRLENASPATAIADALGALLEAVKPVKRFAK